MTTPKPTAAQIEAAIMGDADRFRKLAHKHAEKSDAAKWCEVVCFPNYAPDEFAPVELPLADIADALPMPPPGADSATAQG